LIRLFSNGRCTLTRGLEPFATTDIQISTTCIYLCPSVCLPICLPACLHIQYRACLHIPTYTPLYTPAPCPAHLYKPRRVPSLDSAFKPVCHRNLETIVYSEAVRSVNYMLYATEPWMPLFLLQTTICYYMYYVSLSCMCFCTCYMCVCVFVCLCVCVCVYVSCTRPARFSMHLAPLRLRSL
jgi:hypothetical protein